MTKTLTALFLISAAIAFGLILLLVSRPVASDPVTTLLILSAFTFLASGFALGDRLPRA